MTLATLFCKTCSLRDNVILFADTLLKYLKKYKASPKGKENFKWEGNFDDLKAFVSLILKAEGDWSGSEKKSTGKLIFKEKHGKFCLNWWKSKHTREAHITFSRKA